ncbi:DUF1461 domain-containing protein [archaeon]|jgi:integral membrane protein (TIGR01906 family)|nr:DUF1461 domain-containing protein [archaeon]MBT3451417.1 DUF1461 domain-containing protein [archaeon]MBT6869238.1 DUF1461 domain-containing protein [archaeon]MBT7193636.1 DUF1461 domain-containing protein [archaeon]MBT7380254.1 DUF1461 domain-containing protein [archaeon]
MKIKNIDWFKISKVIFIIIIPIFFLLLSYKVVMFNTELNENQQLVIDYVNSNNNLEEQNVLQSYLLEQDITSQELSHLDDVNKVIQWKNYLFYALLLLLTLILTFYKKEKDKINILIKYGTISGLVFSLFLLIVSLFNFMKIFEVFHLILFPQGNWQFPLESFLITTFSESFFFLIAKEIFISNVFVLGVILIVLLVINYISKRYVMIK